MIDHATAKTADTQTAGPRLVLVMPVTKLQPRRTVQIIDGQLTAVSDVNLPVIVSAADSLADVHQFD